MRAKEFINESVKPLDVEVSRALPGSWVIPALKNQDPYRQLRFSVALAGAKGAKRREEDGVPQFNGETIWGENQIIVGYGDNIEQYIDDALQQLGISGKKQISTSKSEEMVSVNKQSVTKPFGGY